MKLIYLLFFMISQTLGALAVKPPKLVPKTPSLEVQEAYTILFPIEYATLLFQHRKDPQLAYKNLSQLKLELESSRYSFEKKLYATHLLLEVYEELKKTAIKEND